jgi:DNA-binding response OmpR family regulator
VAFQPRLTAMTRSVLVVEDEPDIATLIERSLRDLSCCVKVAFDGETGLREARSRSRDLIILDRMLPATDGLAIARSLRAELNQTPILMLTARAGESERMLGLESGADDYLTKPFGIGSSRLACAPCFAGPANSPQRQRRRR